MSTTIVMPKAGLTMVEGTISQWLVTEGAHVKKGDALMEYENEKNTIECDALADGYVHILAQEGDTIPVGEPIGILAESPEELARRPLYRELLALGVFDVRVWLDGQKNWREETAGC